MQNTVKFVNKPYDKPGDLQNLLHYAMTTNRLAHGANTQAV